MLALTPPVGVCPSPNGDKPKPRPHPPMRATRAVVGVGGLEPPTLRLSGVRSNHLSYTPPGPWVTHKAAGRAHETRSELTGPASPWWSQPARQRRAKPRIRMAPPMRRSRIGGASRDRTGDLMLAKHALSQLSYGPARSAPLHARPRSRGLSRLPLTRLPEGI